jgi:hypothetical protein
VLCGGAPDLVKSWLGLLAAHLLAVAFCGSITVVGNLVRVNMARTEDCYRRTRTTMIPSKGGRPPLPPGKKRIKIAPTLQREAIDALRLLAERKKISQSEVLNWLLLREAKRLKPKP